MDQFKVENENLLVIKKKLCEKENNKDLSKDDYQLWLLEALPSLDEGILVLHNSDDISQYTIYGKMNESLT